jgi:hypothetical protein
MDTGYFGSNGGAAGAQTTTVETNSDEVNDMAHQVEADVSNFEQQDDRNQQGLTALLQQMSQQLQAVNAQVQKDGTQIERLESWVKSNRR